MSSRFGWGLKITAFLFFLLGSLFFLSAPAWAHFIETDGSVLIMLHAGADDDPIIGETSNLTFYITDSQKKFKAPQCDCRLSISLDGSEVFSTTTFKHGNNNPIFSYVFPQKGIYTVQFTANPLVKDGFQNFAFNYDLRVERTAEQANTAKAHAYRLYIIILGILIILTVLFLNHRQLKKSVLGLFILLFAFGMFFHQSQIFCPDHERGSHIGQYDCCFLPSIESSPNLSVIQPMTLKEVANIKPQRPSKIKIIFSLNDKSPPRQFS